MLIGTARIQKKKCKPCHCKLYLQKTRRWRLVENDDQRKGLLRVKAIDHVARNRAPPWIFSVAVVDLLRPMPTFPNTWSSLEYSDASKSACGQASA